jgi:hypothetical protein
LAQPCDEALSLARRYYNLCFFLYFPTWGCGFCEPLRKGTAFVRGTWRYPQLMQSRLQHSVIDSGEVDCRAESYMPCCQAPRVPDFLTVELTPSNDNCAPARQPMNFHEGSGESSRPSACGRAFRFCNLFGRGPLSFNWQEHLLLPCRGFAGFLGFRGFARNRLLSASMPWARAWRLPSPPSRRESNAGRKAISFTSGYGARGRSDYFR